MPANTSIYTGADGSISLSVPQGKEGDTAQGVLTAYDLISVGRVQSVRVEVRSEIKTYNELGSRYPTQLRPGNAWLDNRDTHNIFATGRLKAGVAPRQAEASLNVLAAQLGKEYPNIYSLEDRQYHSRIVFLKWEARPDGYHATVWDAQSDSYVDLRADYDASAPGNPMGLPDTSPAPKKD